MARRSVVIDLEVRNKQARKALQGVEGGFTRLSQKTQQTTSAMGQGFNRASQRVAGSQNAVMNLSRIVEDAPFGARGVANNINPFIESFQRLKTQTGSTTSALKTLLTSAFTGPGALLTISALVTSAMTAIQMGLLDLGDEAEDTLEELDGLLGSFDRVIELQEQFGAFEGDEFGIEKMNAQIREISEDLMEERRALSRINDLEDQRSEIVRKRPDPTTRTEEQKKQIKQIKQELRHIGDREKIEKNIEELEQERLQLSIDIRNTAEALTDEDTQQAKLAQEKRKEQEKQKELAEAELEAARALNKARQAVSPSQPQHEIAGLGGSQQFSDMDVPMPDLSDMGGVDTGAPIGSIKGLKNELSGLQEDFDNAFTDEQRNKLAERIKDVKGEIEDMGGSLEDAGETGASSFEKMSNQAFNAAASQVLVADNAEDAASRIIETLIAQFAAYAIRAALRDLPFPANIAAAGGAAVAARGLKSMIPSFETGVDNFEGGIARVHKDELITNLPPGANVITNENVEKMHQMQRQGKNIATASTMNVDGLRKEVRVGMQEAMKNMGIQVNLSTESMAQEIGKFVDYQKRIGNNPPF